MNKALGVSVALFIIFVWRRWLGPWYNKRNNIICRFHPSCSRYAILSLTKHGLVKGLYLTYKRLRKCNPQSICSCVDYP